MRRARSADRAQQVVLAAAVFDAEGRIMVSPEGFLPNRKITNTFVERVSRLYEHNMEIFDTAAVLR